MICPKCNKQMKSEFETNARNSHQYMAFFTCYQCGTACNQDVLEIKGGIRVLSEKWFGLGEKDNKNESTN